MIAIKIIMNTYFMPGILLRVSYAMNHLNLTDIATIIPILQIRKWASIK